MAVVITAYDVKVSHDQGDVKVYVPLQTFDFKHLNCHGDQKRNTYNYLGVGGNVVMGQVLLVTLDGKHLLIPYT